jgi:CMP-N,N'-diacetyllegionaminic acid synthase
MKYAVIIPARGGSKGIPGKNIKMINGKPLIAWTIEHALSCEFVSNVFVSTDSEEIKEISIRYGADVPFLRPVEISGDEATTESAMLHFLFWAENNNLNIDNIILMQPTSPFRYENRLNKAIEQFEREGADSLLSVCKSHRFIWKMDFSGKSTANYDVNTRPRRQDIKSQDEIYLENGSFYITKKDLFKKHENRLCGKIKMHQMEPEESIEIDDPIDFRMLAFLMKEYGV